MVSSKTEGMDFRKIACGFGVYTAAVIFLYLMTGMNAVNMRELHASVLMAVYTACCIFYVANVFNNSAKKGSLDGCKLMCDDCVNGDYYKPRCFFSLVGMPKNAKYPRRYIFPNIITDADEMIKEYEQR